MESTILIASFSSSLVTVRGDQTAVLLTLCSGRSNCLLSASKIGGSNDEWCFGLSNVDGTASIFGHGRFLGIFRRLIRLHPPAQDLSDCGKAANFHCPSIRLNYPWFLFCPGLPPPLWLSLSICVRLSPVIVIPHVILTWNPLPGPGCILFFFLFFCLPLPTCFVSQSHPN